MKGLNELTLPRLMKIYREYGVNLPLYPRVINHGVQSYGATAAAVDQLAEKGGEVEWEKIPVLVSSPGYMTFLSLLANTQTERLVELLNAFLMDEEFRCSFSPALQQLNQFEHAGDLRFHGVTLYCLVRALRPEVVIETGVANGKSSALVLLAMHHNGRGRLYSIDLPNEMGNRLADGGLTSTEGRETGWMVPVYLRDRWRLHLGDSRELLPRVIDDVIKGGREIDVFLHDSLHTYEHAAFEFSVVLPHLKSGSVLACDNIDMEAGEAFHECLVERKLTGHAYRDFAAVRLS